MKFYVVTMHRWGGEDTHNYVIGVYDNYELASMEGLGHKQWRGGKYEYKITEIYINKTRYNSEE